MENQQGEGAEVCTFGLHLTLDGYGGNSEKLNDPELVKRVLDELPGKIGMEKISEPIVLKAEPRNVKDGGGYSGFVVIAESHISVHTFPKRKFVTADVYTCRDELDKDFTVEYFKNVFELEDMEINFFKRGTRFPKNDLA